MARAGLGSMVASSVRSLNGCIEQLGNSPTAVVVTAEKPGVVTRLRLDAGEKRLEVRVETDLGLLIGVCLDLPILFAGDTNGMAATATDDPPEPTASASPADTSREGRSSAEIPEVFREYFATLDWN